MIKKTSNLVRNILIGLTIIGFVTVFFWFRNNVFDYFFLQDQALQMLNKSDREELETLKVENLILKNRIKDFEKEMNLLEDGLEPVYVQMISNNIVTNIASNFYGSFYTTLPKDKTVYKGMNIYSHGNIVVGIVEEVQDKKLFATRLGQNKAFIAESNDVDEEIELSSLGAGLYAGGIAVGSKISVGDQIVLKGYPKAVVGMVGEIIKNEGTLSTVFVRTPYNINNKELFYVLQ